MKSKDDLNELIQDEKQLREKQNTDYMNSLSNLEHSLEVLQVKSIFSFINIFIICSNVSFTLADIFANYVLHVSDHAMLHNNNIL